MSEPVRIQKLLAGWGVASRRAIEKMIEEGRIEIDGEMLVEQGRFVDPDNPPVIKINGKQIRRPEQREHAIYIFYKPIDVVTTLNDECGRKTIREFLPADRRLYPIGRLDRDSTGLLLITDHGELTNRLLHPSYKVEKEYIVSLFDSPLTSAECAQFRSGVELDDGKTAPCELSQLKESLTYSVIIREGKKRQIRRMFASFGRQVKSLHRVRFGPIDLGNLRPGEIRPLSAKERSALLNAAGLNDQ
ncbi:MAG: pseudouridine synthase [Candidatus Riflebacteria bacterium HGW-Riflebacteria-1]|jgi:23S rRNA pseudouridine2605 synthase|nr:MAG: pseudouridine synthase [Candidatus Riflebacteria bacterium HGW-Riflebacteria-1]